jgi:hypothetical protein
VVRRVPLVPLSAAGRFVVGGGALLAPRLVARVFAIDDDPSSASVYVGRLFGVRAVSMAVQALVTSGEERRRQLRFAVAVDVVDALAAIAAGRSGQLTRRAARVACAAAVAEAGLGVAALRAGAAAGSR